MSRFFPGHAARRSEPSDPGEPAGAAVYWRALRNADRACCCPARPLLSRSCLRYPAGTTRRTCCCAVTITGCPGKRSRRRARSSSTRPACQSHRQLRFRRWPAESRWRPAAPAGCVSSPRPAWPLPGLSGRSRRAWSVPGQGGSGFSGSEHRAVARRSRARPGSAGGCSAGRCSAGRPPGNLSASGKGRSGAAGARSPRRVAPRARAWRASPGRKAHGAAVSPARAAARRGCGLPWPGPGRGAAGIGTVREGSAGWDEWSRSRDLRPCHPRLVPQSLGGSRTRSADELLSVCYGRWPWDWCHPGHYGPRDAPQGACGRPRVSSRCPVRSGTGHRTPGAPPARRDGQAGKLGPCRTPSGRAARADDSMRIDGAESHQGRACWIAGSMGPPLGGGDRRRPVARNG